MCFQETQASGHDLRLHSLLELLLVLFQKGPGADSYCKNVLMFQILWQVELHPCLRFSLRLLGFNGPLNGQSQARLEPCRRQSPSQGWPISSTPLVSQARSHAARVRPSGCWSRV